MNSQGSGGNSERTNQETLPRPWSECLFQAGSCSLPPPRLPGPEGGKKTARQLSLRRAKEGSKTISHHLRYSFVKGNQPDGKSYWKRRARMLQHRENRALMMRMNMLNTLKMTSVLSTRNSKFCFQHNIHWVRGS